MAATPTPIWEGGFVQPPSRWREEGIGPKRLLMSCRESDDISCDATGSSLSLSPPPFGMWTETGMLAAIAPLPCVVPNNVQLLQELGGVHHALGACLRVVREGGREDAVETTNTHSCDDDKDTKIGGSSPAANEFITSRESVKEALLKLQASIQQRQPQMVRYRVAVLLQAQVAEKQRLLHKLQAERMTAEKLLTSSEAEEH